MKKFVKLSLAAAVATAGLTTTASAVSLEEAIKGVDVSGQFRYRMQEKTIENGAQDNGTDVEIEVGVKVPVNDNVTAVFKIDNANDDTESVTKGGVTIEDYYFAYTNGAVTAHFGQQNIPGRMTDGAQGDGAVVLYNTGAGITLGAAAFITNSASNGNALAAGKTNALIGGTDTVDIDDQDVYSVMAMGNVGPVAFMGQYADVKDTLEAYNVKADVNVEGIKLGAEYTSVELDSASSLEFETTKVYASASIEKLSLKATFATTGDNGSGSIDSFAGSTVTSGFSTETPSEFLLWNVGTAGRDDADILAIDASYPITDTITLRAAYADGEQGTADVTETLGQVSYKMSKNLNTYFRYAEVEDGATEYNRGRIEVAYKF